ncbi:recombinase family protein [Corynebacterium terpenotabidum]|uniref:Recombinase n=1 Tax=Corynebacterium terpenotabidum Y-11 TaxID=1200352 RepID=S4XII9_9CORY|nr:recombinase family protein [Corynebacterium terpenotabidum]AGP31525.1 recombinase [Corynebacterium terpenotabidum Y-11]
MSYFVYVRISRDQAGTGQGVSRQEAACKRFAEQRGLDVSETFTDNDISAFGNKGRPAYREMLTRLENGEAEGIIAWHVDRLYRRTRDLEEIVDLVEKTEITVRTVEAGELDLNTATGRLTARLVASIGNYEVDHMIERQRLSQTARALEGKFRGGGVPYGYDLGKEPGTLVINETEAEVVRDMAAELLSGTPVLTISRKLNKAGIPTKTGNKWLTSTVRRTLAKPAIAGKADHHGEIVAEAQWPAILPESEWLAVRALLSDPSRRTQQGNERQWQGSGVYRCGKCGGRMGIGNAGSRASRVNGRKKKAYLCRDCRSLSRDQICVDELVDAVILGVLDMPENRLMAANRDTTAGEDVAALLSERNALTARKNELGALYASGTIDAAVLASGSAQFKQDIDRLDKRITAARTVSPVADLLLSGDELRDRWAAMSADKRAQVIDALVTVTILPAGRGPRFDPSKIQIEWKAPPV